MCSFRVVVGFFSLAVLIITQLDFLAPTFFALFSVPCFCNSQPKLAIDRSGLQLANARSEPSLASFRKGLNESRQRLVFPNTIAHEAASHEIRRLIIASQTTRLKVVKREKRAIFGSFSAIDTAPAVSIIDRVPRALSDPAA